MELRHLRYFVALTEELSFTRAARRVHVSQPTLSHQIRQLEDELGQQLFDRAGKQIRISDAGETFLSYASRAVREVDRGVSELAQAPRQITGHLRIGASQTFTIQFLPRCLALLTARYPIAQVRVEELAARMISRRLIDGELDVGIAYDPDNEKQLLFEPLYNEEMVLAVSPKHTFAKKKRMRMVELHRQPMALLPKGFATRSLLDECFTACGAEPIIAVEIENVGPMLELVARTSLAAIVSSQVVVGRGDVCVVPLEGPTPMRTPGILWKSDARRTPAARSFAAIVRKLAAGRTFQAPR